MIVFVMIIGVNVYDKCVIIFVIHYYKYLYNLCTDILMYNKVSCEETKGFYFLPKLN